MCGFHTHFPTDTKKQHYQLKTPPETPPKTTIPPTHKPPTPPAIRNPQFIIGGQSTRERRPAADTRDNVLLVASLVSARVRRKVARRHVGAPATPERSRRTAANCWKPRTNAHLPFRPAGHQGLFSSRGFARVVLGRRK